MVIWVLGLEGQGLGADGPSGRIARFSVITILLSLSTILTPANEFSEPLASLGESLEFQTLVEGCTPPQ